MRLGLGLGLPVTGQDLVVGAYAPPTLNTVTPSSGPEVGGTSLVLLGSDFQPAAAAFVDGNAAATTFVDSQQITCVTPAGVGLVDVRVDNPDAQTDTAPNAFTYIPAPTVAAVLPVLGPAAGGTPVAIDGTAFQVGCGVTFGGASATNVVRVSSILVTCDTPAHAVGVVDIVVTNPDTQTSGASGAGLYTYV